MTLAPLHGYPKLSYSSQAPIAHLGPFCIAAFAQIDAIKAAADGRQTQLDRDTDVLRQQQDELHLLRRDFQQQVRRSMSSMMAVA